MTGIDRQMSTGLGLVIRSFIHAALGWYDPGGSFVEN